MRLAICYVSNSNVNLSTSQIQELLSETQYLNNKNNIKGLLLFSDGNFFQVLEGKTEKVLPLWQKIKKDERHQSIIKIFEEKITTPPFDGFLCDYIAEEEKYQYDYLKRIFDQLKSLDDKPRDTALEVLKLFLKYQ